MGKYWINKTYESSTCICQPLLHLFPHKEPFSGYQGRKPMAFSCPFFLCHAADVADNWAMKLLNNLYDTVLQLFGTSVCMCAHAWSFRGCRAGCMCLWQDRQTDWNHKMLPVTILGWVDIMSRFYFLYYTLLTSPKSLQSVFIIRK